jgi:hypothetical protein
LVVDDLSARGLEDGCPEFTAGLSAGYYDDLIRDKNSECFHVGVVLKLRDGRWVMIDPHGLCWGLLSDEWNMADVSKVLKKYQGVLPGLTLVAKDEHAGEAVLDGVQSKALDLINRSRRMEEKIRARVRTVMDLVEVMLESEDFDLLMHMDDERTGQELLDFSSPEFREYAVMLTAMGGQENLFNFPAVFDPKFLEKRIKSWLTYYHACAMNMFLNRETDEGKLVHPICEVPASVEWAVAISAINSARFRIEPDTDREGIEEFFIRNSFDQTTLFNAAGLLHEQLGIAAGETLRSLRHVHPMCARRIQYQERRFWL